MKKLIAILAALLVLPVALAIDVGSGIELDITPTEFGPRIWLCDEGILTDDAIESGRMTDVGDVLDERIGDYAFEGEQISLEVLIMDKNKIEEISDVYITLGSTQGVGNAVEVECAETSRFADQDPLPAECNARLGEELLTVFDEDTMDYYECVFTVETPESMEGEYFITAEVVGVDGEDIIDENLYFYLNPTIALTVDGSLSFSDVLPGSVAYSTTLLVGNDADDGSGVLLDMFISGTDFYDPASSGAKCPTTNHLKLSDDRRSAASLGAGLASGWTRTHDCDIDDWINNPAELGVDNHDHLCYYASNGAYNTVSGGGDNPNADDEGYKPIVYSDAFTRDFYNDAEIIDNDDLIINGIVYDAGNVLAPGGEIAVTFKLGLPEPCVGDFSDGDIFFWGEAI